MLSQKNKSNHSRLPKAFSFVPHQLKSLPPQIHVCIFVPLVSAFPKFPGEQEATVISFEICIKFGCLSPGSLIWRLSRLRKGFLCYQTRFKSFITNSPVQHIMRSCSCRQGIHSSIKRLKLKLPDRGPLSIITSQVFYNDNLLWKLATVRLLRALQIKSKLTQDELGLISKRRHFSSLLKPDSLCRRQSQEAEMIATLSICWSLKL